MTFVIVQAQKKDISSMYHVSQQAHASSYYDALIPKAHRDHYERVYSNTAENAARFSRAMEGRLGDKCWSLYGAKDSSGNLIGYTIRYQASKELVYLKGLFVRPEWHGKGVGSALFAKSIQGIAPGARIELSVIKNNELAKSIYLKHGFSVVGLDDKSFFGAEQVRMELIAT